MFVCRGEGGGGGAGKSPSRQREQHGGSAGEASVQGHQWELRAERRGDGAQPGRGDGFHSKRFWGI